MSDTNFLCRPCRHLMCDDCKQVADEYAELLTMRTRALLTAEHTIGKLNEQLAEVKRKAAMWEELSKTFEIIIKWLAERTLG